MQRIYIILVASVVSLFAALPCSAQFNTGFINTAPPGANTMEQNSNNDEEPVVTSTKPAFNVKRYFNSLAHKDSMKVNQMAIGSMILPGTAQIYNRQYWKLPVVYGAIGGCVGGAIANRGKDSQKYFIAGALACYWGSVLDGVISYKSKEKPLPARASMLSAIL